MGPKKKAGQAFGAEMAKDRTHAFGSSNDKRQGACIWQQR